MAREDFDLGRVVSPIGVDEFLDQYWEKKPLIIQRDDPNYFTSLLSLEDVDDLICTRDLRTPALKLVKKGSSIPVANYSANKPWGNDTFTNLVDVDKVFTEYQQGATIVLQALHRWWRPLGIFCRSLETQFNYPVQTNIYLTPPAAQGFAAHYDTHDVFVLQLAGEKHWLIYNSPEELPDKNKPYNKTTTPKPELVQEVDLKAGDLIYLPRGFVHEALTSDQKSLHITVGVVVYTWGDVLVEALTQIQQSDARFRQSLPSELLNSPNKAESMRDQFSQLVELFGQETNLNNVVNRIESRFLSSRVPLQENRLTNLTYLDQINLDTRFKQRTAVIAKLNTVKDSATLTYEGKRITLPGFVMPALEFILANKQFQAKDLPGILDDAGKVVLLRRLVKEGFLNIDRGN